jgi:hypothetical protein
VSNPKESVFPHSQDHVHRASKANVKAHHDELVGTWKPEVPEASQAPETEPFTLIPHPDNGWGPAPYSPHGHLDWSHLHKGYSHPNIKKALASAANGVGVSNSIGFAAELVSPSSRSEFRYWLQTIGWHHAGLMLAVQFALGRWYYAQYRQEIPFKFADQEVLPTFGLVQGEHPIVLSLGRCGAVFNHSRCFQGKSHSGPHASYAPGEWTLFQAGNSNSVEKCSKFIMREMVHNGKKYVRRDFCGLDASHDGMGVPHMTALSTTAPAAIGKFSSTAAAQAEELWNAALNHGSTGQAQMLQNGEAATAYYLPLFPPSGVATFTQKMMSSDAISAKEFTSALHPNSLAPKKVVPADGLELVVSFGFGQEPFVLKTAGHIEMVHTIEDPQVLDWNHTSVLGSSLGSKQKTVTRVHLEGVTMNDLVPWFESAQKHQATALAQEVEKVQKKYAGKVPLTVLMTLKNVASFLFKV